MQPIDLSKLSKLTAEMSSIESDKKSDSPTVKETNLSSKDISSQLTSAMAEKQRLAIGLILKQTLQNLSKEGLLSVDTQKAILSAKNSLPGEFTQLYIQDRVQQHKLADTLASLQLKPAPLTNGTVNQWFSGQLIQSIVYSTPKDGTASLLVNGSGQFSPSPSIISQLNILQQSDNKLLNNEIIKNSQIVQIKTDLLIEPGQQLLLQVKKEASEVTFALKHPPKESNLISQVINQLVSRQQALPELIASLKEIATQTNQANTYFTPPFKAQVMSVLQQFPPLTQLSNGNEVKNAIQNSGLYLESKIVNTGTTVNITQQTQAQANLTNSSATLNSPMVTTDLKAALSQLVTLIKNNEALLLPKLLTSESSTYKNIAFDGQNKPHTQSSPFFDLPANVTHAQVQKPVADSNLFQLNNHLLLQNRILDQLEGVLSRITVTQFQTRESSDQSILNVEIPFRHGEQQEILQLKIREQFKEKEAEEGNKIWTVNMAFDLNTLGSIRIYITLDKKDLAIQIWTEDKQAQKLFQENFQLLSERLIEAGFTLSQLAAYHGLPEEAEQEQEKSHFIINERV